MLERAKGISLRLLLTKSTESFGDAYELGNLIDARRSGSPISAGYLSPIFDRRQMV